MGDMMGTSGEKDNSGAQAMPTPEQMAAMTPEQLAEMQQKAAAAQSMQKQIDADGGKITMKGLRLGVEGGLIDQASSSRAPTIWRTKWVPCRAPS